MGFLLAFAALMSVSTGIAFWKGGPPERIAATAFWVAWIASFLVQADRSSAWRGLQVGYLLVDTALLLVLLALALRANRHWPIAAVGLQVIIVLVHGLVAVNPGTLASAYAIMAAFWPFLQLIVLLAGTVLLMRRRRSEGAVRSWSSSSRQSASSRKP